MLPADAREAAFLALVDYGASGSASRICLLAPSMWWKAFDTAVASDIDQRELRDRASTLRAVINTVGPASIGHSPTPAHEPRHLLLVAQAADIGVALWRQMAVHEWLDFVEDPPESDGSVPDTEWEALLSRGYVIGLMSAMASGTREYRVRAWVTCFHRLHEALAQNALDPDSSVGLNSLVGSPSRSECQRLREAAAAEVVRDRWEDERVDEMLSGASSTLRTQLYEAIASSRKKRRGWGILWWIDELLD